MHFSSGWRRRNCATQVVLVVCRQFVLSHSWPWKKQSLEWVRSRASGKRKMHGFLGMKSAGERALCAQSKLASQRRRGQEEASCPHGSVGAGKGAGMDREASATVSCERVGDLGGGPGRRPRVDARRMARVCAAWSPQEAVIPLDGEQRRRRANGPRGRVDNRAGFRMGFCPGLVSHLRGAPQVPKALPDRPTDGFSPIEALPNPECGHPSRSAVPAAPGRSSTVDLLYRGGGHRRIDKVPTRRCSSTRHGAIGQGDCTRDANPRPRRSGHLAWRVGNFRLLWQSNFRLRREWDLA